MPATLPSGRSRIVLVGFMAAGKTTVGRQVAEILGWELVDLDALVAERARKPAEAVFRDEGEGAFRSAEHEAAVEASQKQYAVIAAGGGAFVDPRTRAVLSADAITVWLRCELPVLLERIGTGAGRPLARSRETITALLTEREPIYRLADLEVDTTSAAPPDVAREIAFAAMSIGSGTTDT